MRRILSEVLAYVGDLGRSSARAWNAFFFTPADPTALGLMRLLIGALLAWDLAVLGLDLKAYLGADGWIGPEAVRHYLAERSPWAWSLWFWVPDRWLVPVWGACLAVAVMFAVGLFSRVTAVLAWAVAVSIVRRAPVALFGFDHLLATWAFYLALFGASGQAVALDRFFARLRDLRRGESRPSPNGAPELSVSANLSLRLIQLHLALIYGSAGLSKLMGPEWWNGSAMEMIILTPEFRRFDLTWLSAYPGPLHLLTHAGLALEVSYPVLIWSRKLRPVVIASASAMHLGIDLLLGLTEFGLAMIVANLSFASGPWLRSLVAGRDQPAGRLLYDGRSRLAWSRATLILAADPDAILEGVDLARRPSPAPPPGHPAVVAGPLTLIRGDGRRFEGVDAVIVAASWMPMLCPFGYVARLPGLRWLASKLLGPFEEVRIPSSVGQRGGPPCRAMPANRIGAAETREAAMSPSLDTPEPIR